jgi:hypothetical protein
MRRKKSPGKRAGIVDGLIFSAQAAPNRPQIGGCVVFFDRVANKLKVIKPNGTVVSLEG